MKAAIAVVGWNGLVPRSRAFPGQAMGTDPAGGEGACHAALQLPLPFTLSCRETFHRNTDGRFPLAHCPLPFRAGRSPQI